MTAMSLIFDIIANDKTASGLDAAGQAIDGTASRWGAMRTTAVAGGLAAGAAAVKFGTDSVAAYSESEQSAQQLQYALDQFPATADTNADRLMDLNSALALKTKFDDDAAASGQAVLAQYGLTGAQLEELTPLLEDYAAKTGKDLPTAAEDLGKAVLGQGRALRGIGVDFTDTGSAAGNFTELVGALNSQVGGFAEDQGQTAAATSDRLNNAFGELQETAGGMLAPALQAVTEKGVAILGWMQDNPTATKVLIGVIGALVLVYAALSAAQTVSAGMSAIQAAGVAASGTAAAGATAPTVSFAAGLWAVSWPILAIVAAIALLAAGVYLVISNWDTIGPWLSDLWDTIWGGLTDAWNAFWGFLEGVRDGIIDALTGAWDFIKEVFSWSPLGLLIDNWGGITDFFSGVWNGAVDASTTAFRAIANLWNSTVGSLSFTTPDWFPFGLGGKTYSMPHIPVPALAAGGIITRATLMMAGEAGVEGVFPLSRAREFGFGGGDGAGSEVVVEVPLYLDGRELARGVYRANLGAR